MPCVILLPEILEYICSYLDNSDLAHVARVSKTFHHAAIHILWEEVLDISYLVNLFPSDAVTSMPNSIVRFHNPHSSPYSM
jgi:hypothetical protein